MAPPSKPQRNWTDDDIGNIIKMKQSGKYTWREIAKHFNVTRETVRNLFRYYSGKKPNGPAGSEAAEEEIPEQTLDITETEGGLVINAEGPQIKTLPQLLEASETDTSKWFVKEHTINKWDGFIKNAAHRPERFPLFQVKAYLKLIDDKYIVSAPEINIPELPTPRPIGKFKPITGVVLGDNQIGYELDVDTGTLLPFHDRAAQEVATQIIGAIQPDFIVHLGDLLDLTDWQGRYPRPANQKLLTRYAINEATWFLARLRAHAPKSEMFLLEGNHDNRIIRHMNDKMPEAFDLVTAEGEHILSLRALLSLRKMNIQLVDGYPNNRVDIGNARFVHGDIARKGIGASAKAFFDAEFSERSIIFGHTHRPEMLYDGFEDIYSYSPGCLCKVDTPIVPGHTRKQRWGQGIGIIKMAAGKIDSIKHVTINDGSAVFNGQLYQAEEERIRQMIIQQTSIKTITL